MPKYPGISPYDNEKGTLGTAKKRWEKIYVKEIKSDTIDSMHAEIQHLATTAENSVSHAVAAKDEAEQAKTAAETAAENAATAAAGIQSVVETDVDRTLSIPGVAADAKVTGDWLRDIAKPVTPDTSMPATAYAEEFMKVTTDSEGRVLYGVKRDGTFTWQKGVPKHLQDKINELEAPTIDNDEYMYVMLDSDQHVLFGVKKDGSFDWQKGLPKPVKEKLEEVAQTVIQSEEFVQLTQDSEGNLIEGVRDDGSKVFFSPVRFAGGMNLSSSDVDKIEDALRSRGNSGFDYKRYIKPIPHSTESGGRNFAGYDVFYLDGNTDGMTKDNKVNLNFSFRGVTGTCTCKWQGQVTSLAFPKKNYNVAKLSPKLDVGWGAQKKYTLKGEITDYSYARNIVCARLWAQIVKSRVPAANIKVLESPNYGAIDGFPVMLVMNDEYQGLYNLNLPKEGFLFGMDDGEYEAVLQAESGTHLSTVFKGTTTKEEVEAEQSWSVVYVPDEDNIDWAVNSLNRMITAVMNSTGANYRETLEDYLDIESAIDYYIHLVLLGNRDGYHRNFLMYTFDSVKWAFSAYDMDNTIGSWTFGVNYANPKTFDNFRYYQNQSRVFHLIYTYDKAALKARYAELRDTVLSENNVMVELIKYINQLSKPVMDEEARMEPTRGGTMTNNFEQMVAWYRERCRYMDEEINNL